MLNANTYVTNEKGIGGTIRNQYEDFYVEEIPEMAPTGEGPNIWIWIEKDWDEWRRSENISI